MKLHDINEYFGTNRHICLAQIMRLILALSATNWSDKQTSNQPTDKTGWLAGNLTKFRVFSCSRYLFRIYCVLFHYMHSFTGRICRLLFCVQITDRTHQDDSMFHLRFKPKTNKHTYTHDIMMRNICHNLSRKTSKSSFCRALHKTHEEQCAAQRGKKYNSETTNDNGDDDDDTQQRSPTNINLRSNEWAECVYGINANRNNENATKRYE